MKSAEKTVLRSFLCTKCTTAVAIISIVVLICMDFAIKEPLFAYSIGPDGIQAMQKNITEQAGKNWKKFSDLGGSKEILVLLGVGFLLCSREKYFYFLVIYMLDKMQIGYLKLAFHDPRPYMAEGQIHPLSCSKAFGNPSGHSSASWAFAITVFLETMHGKWHFKRADNTPATGIHGWIAWAVVLFLCLGWCTMIPLSRYILGVHSLDQIILGSCLGIWTGLTCHFIIRDNLLAFLKKIKRTDRDENDENGIQPLEKYYA